MATYTLDDEDLYYLDDMSTDMPNTMARWDSHELSPRQAAAAKLAVEEQPTPKPVARRQSRPQGKIARRKRLRAPQRLDGTDPTPWMADEDDESYDEEIKSENTKARELDEVKSNHSGPDGSTTALSPFRSPSQKLLFGKNGEDVEEIGQWYFVCQLPEHDREFFTSVQDNWVKDIWDMGRSSESIFSALGAFALHKKALLGGNQARPDYYEQKGQIIQDIVAEIQRSPNGPNSHTVLAMAVLAYLDIRDDQFDAAATHLRAVRNFIDMPSMSPQGWLYCVWIDLRQALFTGTEPNLPFYVPVAFRGVPKSLQSYQREAFRLGGINASQCPRSPVFTLDMASDLLGKLHALCYCSEIVQASESPPFGQVYALEYGLRVVQARAKHNDKDHLTAPILLISSAIQLHVWMAARFYTPQARETHLGLINMACEVISGFDDMITQWYIAAGLESLIWVLFTLAASLRAHERPQTTEMVGLLYKALRKARINTCEDLEAKLRQWPWLANWHPVQIDTVWEMLCARYPDLVPRIAVRNVPGTTQDPNKARHRWFLGGLEFYNSL